jgi:hypothetical protein
MPLGPNQQALVARADLGQLRKEFQRVVQQWPRNRWLSERNRYALDTINKLETDSDPGGVLAHVQLSRYIAASALVHCVDGWSYTARALAAVMSGDIHAAIHLAYYAELRAAMSLLAVAGIGVFDDRHFVLTSDGKCHIVKGGTHAFAWDALSHWAAQPSARDLVLEVIQPGSVTLDGWLQHFPAAAGTALRGRVVASWLLDWGLDLRLFVEDREARNQASYRPTSIAHARKAHFSQSLEFLEGFWTSFEPTAIHPFRVLDRYLLRRSMVQAFIASNGSSPRRAPRAYRRFVRVVLHAVNPGDMTMSNWEAFLDVTRGVPQEIPVIEAAEGRADKSSGVYHIQIIARAAMLLRVATGACRQLLATASLSERSNLGFWWRAFGEDRGFWGSTTVPANLVDLWTDVDAAIAQSKAWRAGSGSRQEFFASNANAARTLSTCERIPLWGLGI